jgi:hypothetical protein
MLIRFVIFTLHVKVFTALHCWTFRIYGLPRRVAPRDDTIMILCHCELPKSAWQSSEIDKEPFFHNP